MGIPLATKEELKTNREDGGWIDFGFSELFLGASCVLCVRGARVPKTSYSIDIAHPDDVTGKSWDLADSLEQGVVKGNEENSLCGCGAW